MSVVVVAFSPHFSGPHFSFDLSFPSDDPFLIKLVTATSFQAAHTPLTGANNVQRFVMLHDRNLLYFPFRISRPYL
jgi:hypothetical protein